MKLKDEILINKFGQGLIAIEQLTDRFGLLEVLKKKEFLNDFLYLIMQSKPKKEDIEPAIIYSRLKSTFTPCILLRKGVANHNLEKLVNLPENELTKAFVLLLSLFKIAYNRRFAVEKNNPDKWWYWDLSDNEKVEIIMKS
jgi:hypothetical protein